ncbi:transposase [Klebsiella pneumoniae]|uniref:hypothetical protein n=1 Tax=Klebsiella pneumoniae TaxID=573 RepID=UPI000E2AC51E|nr:hypothetical protein [Klebsiella pneumoniae]SYE17588.1 transposase [Klebsiella pneumoniae]
MGSCAAPSAKGDDKFITTDYLQQCRACYTLRELLSPEGMVLAIQNSLPMKGWRLRMLYNEAIDEEINPLHGDCIELPSRADALQAFVGSGDTPLSDNC